jgi:hypothetical protein
MAENNISEVSYNYDEKFLAMAASFMNIDDISTAKTGMFGYITGITSHTAKDSTFHRNMLYKEFFLNSASLKNSLYNWAKILNYNIALAKPSQTHVALTINIQKLMSTSSISSSGDTASGYRVFKLTKDTNFTIGGLNFMLPHEIEIHAKFNGTIPSVVAFYNRSTSTTNYDDKFITSENLPVLIDGVNATITFNIYQLRKKKVVYDVLTNDILERSLYDINFGSNLVAFKVGYQTPADKVSAPTVWSDLTMYFNESDEPTVPQYAYYTLVNDSTLRVYFATGAAKFRPEFNSRIQVELLTSEGLAGNFPYFGNVTIKDSFLEPIGYTLHNLPDAGVTGGSNQLNFKESKIALIDKLRTRESYITEYDLDTLFRDLKQSRIRANLEVKTIKVRDDFFRRIYSMYVLMRLSSGEIIPTNTVSLEIPFDELTERKFSIAPGSIIVYDRESSRYRLLKSNEIPDPYLYNNDSYVFTTPFLMNLDFEEFPKINSYVTTYSKDINVNAKLNAVNYDTANQINITSYNVQRNNLVDLDKFKITLNVLTDVKDISNLVLVAKINQNGKLIGVAKMSSIPDSTVYYLNVNTSDSFNSRGQYIVENTFYEPNAPEVIIPEIALSGDYTIDIGVYNGSFNSLDDVPIVEYTGLDTIGFAEDVSELVYCPVTINQNTGNVVVERVPLVNGNFYYNEKYNKDMMSTILQLFGALKDATELLENNTELDVKFFNTMGISKNFSSDIVDLRLKFQIKLRGVQSASLEGDIKKAIVSFIENCNSTLDKRFSTSNLITSLEKAFPIIAYIQLYSVNNANIQNVEANANTSFNQISYVPEFLTVKKISGSDDQGNDFRYDITLEYL